MSLPGRPGNSVIYNEVSYNGKQYVIGSVKFNTDEKHFLIDKEDYEEVAKRYWHCAVGGLYISSAYQHPTDGKRKEIYLHNFVMKRYDFPGKGATESIDHINNNGLDNRKENLRLVTQTQQNYNTKQRERKKVELPEDCGIKPEDISRNIWYVKPNGAHGDRFCVEIKGLPAGDIAWKSTSSKKVSLIKKLMETKTKLAELYAEHGLHQIEEEDNKKVLSESYDSIISVALT
jgi:hypothetical protein